MRRNKSRRGKRKHPNSPNIWNQKKVERGREEGGRERVQDKTKHPLPANPNTTIKSSYNIATSWVQLKLECSVKILSYLNLNQVEVWAFLLQVMSQSRIKLIVESQMLINYSSLKKWALNCHAIKFGLI